MKKPLSGPRVAIVGAGAGGLSFAIKLKQQLGFDDFSIFEKGHDIGGTWRDNIYPGCSSDVSMALYSLSTDNHDWPHSHGDSADIYNYWQQLTHKYALYPKIHLHTKVTSAVWDDSRKIHLIHLENLSTYEKWIHEAEILVSAIGVLDTPRYPNIPGLQDFKGEMWHSARWNPNNIDLRNKRVAVVGNGPSATQLIPRITEDPSVQVIEFCRTPNWFMPPIRSKFSRIRRWITLNVPFLQLLYRWLMYWRLELLYVLIFGNNFARRLTMIMARLYVRAVAPKKYHNELVPTYSMGCKRVIFDTGYCKALHRPNLDLNWDGIETIVKDGIITQKGERLPFDIIIFATGFAADVFPLEVHGTKGTIQEYFKEKRGPEAYRGTTYPKFPNFFTIFGPNTLTGHTSVVFTNECQADYIIQLITPILGRQVMTVEVKQEPADAYNKLIQARLSNSVFTHCQSLYKIEGTGKITNIFPGATTLFWLWLRKPKWEDYTGLGLEEWLNRSWKRKRVTYIKWSAPLMLLIGAVSFVI